ncbi:MAG: hypothetical protein Q7T03_01215 [Deltaproteobacteria bacterium]|nr:hypothetical protein [Deltaproteobacteria bacterium]
MIADATSTFNAGLFLSGAEASSYVLSGDATPELAAQLQTVSASLAVVGVEASEFFDAVDQLTVAIDNKDLQSIALHRALVAGLFHSIPKKSLQQAVARVQSPWLGLKQLAPSDVVLADIARKLGGDKSPPTQTHATAAVGFNSGASSIQDPPTSEIEPLLAMPMQMMPAQRLTSELWQTLTLSLSLVLRQELVGGLETEGEGFYDDVVTEDDVPKELLEVGQRVHQMAQMTDAADYIKMANVVLNTISKMHYPHFRMKGFCLLAEELGRHEPLRPFIKDLYAAYFTGCFSATERSEQPSLALMVAASQMKAGLEPGIVRGLLGRAFGLVKVAEPVFRGADARNLEFILSRLPLTDGDWETIKGWVEAFIDCEQWVPKPGEMQTEMASALSEQPVETEPIAILPEVTLRPPLSEEEEDYFRSRLLHKAMHAVVQKQGFTEETFSILIQLATVDRWEATAALAYELLAVHEPFRARLERALSNFSSPYYRAKAEWMLAKASGQNVEEKKRIALVLLSRQAELSRLQNMHELLDYADVKNEADDPLWQFLDRGTPLPLLVEGPASYLRYQVASIVLGMRRDACDRKEENRDREEEEERDREEKEKREEENARSLFLARRRGDFLSLLACRRFENGVPDKLSQIAAIGMVKESASPKALALFMGSLPKPLDEEVLVAAQAAIDTTLSEFPFYKALAEVFLHETNTDSAKPSRKLAGLYKSFLEAAAEDENISNAEAISLLCWLARGNAGSRFGGQLLRMARKRAALYKEQMKDAEEMEEEDDPGDQENWKKLHQQAMAHILSSIPYGKQKESKIEAAIRGLEDPFLEAFAFKVRAKLLGVHREADILEQATHYMEAAIQLLPDIERFSARLSLGMEMLDDILIHPLFSGFSATLAEKLGDRLAQSEAWHVSDLATPNANGVLLDAESLLAMMRGDKLDAETVGRFLTGRHLGKILHRADFSPSIKARLLLGQMQNGPYQGAFDILKPLLEQEETLLPSEHLEHLDRLFATLLAQKNAKAEEYYEQRKKRMVADLVKRGEGRVFNSVEDRWVTFILSKGDGKQLVPLLYAEGLLVEERLRLLERLAVKGLLDEKLLEIYRFLKSKGQANIFFEMIESVTTFLPGAVVTPDLMNFILGSPILQGGGSIQDVIQGLGRNWIDFEKRILPEERLQLLDANPLLMGMYYEQVSRQYDFIGLGYSLEHFSKDVRRTLAERYKLDYSPIARFEAGLELSHPTSAEEKEDCLTGIRANEDLSEEVRLFLEKIVQIDQPLAESDLLDIWRMGVEADIRHIEDLLPANRQRIFRLYFGEAPVVSTTEGFADMRAFVRRFSPVHKERAMSPYSPSLKFRLASQDLKDVLRAGWAVKAIREKGGNEQIETLLHQNLPLNDFVVAVNRLHARLLAQENGIAETKVRGQIKREASVFFNAQIVPLLETEKSHWVGSDYSYSRSQQARASMDYLRFHDLQPDLEPFLTKEPVITERKKEIADRLGLAPGWEQRAGDRVWVEVELLADYFEMDPLLKERYLMVLCNVMQQIAVAQQSETNNFLSFQELERRAQSRGRFEVRFVPKSDVYTALRIGDFRQCCISTDGVFFWPNVPAYLFDRMTLVFAITDPDSQKVVGHMVGHLGFSGVKEETTFFLNGLYLRTSHRGEAMDDAILDILDEFMRAAGVNLVRHGINPYHDVTLKPPHGFKPANSRVVRLQTVTDKDDKIIPLYGDLNLDRTKANQIQGPISHYQRRVRS